MSTLSFSNLNAEILSIIFSYIILQAEDLGSFAKLLFVWAGKRPRAEIKFVLEKLDWDQLYHFHNHFLEVTRDRFTGFVKFSAKNGVVQAMFFQSTRELFRIRDIDMNIGILSSLAEHHFPAHFCFLFFKSIYVRHEFNATAEEMFQLVNRISLRGKITELMDLLESMYEYVAEWDYLLPHTIRCPDAIERHARLKVEGFPDEVGLWNSLCVNTVGHAYQLDDRFHGGRLTYSHLFNGTCECCTMQLIMYKVLLGMVRRD